MLLSLILLSNHMSHSKSCRKYENEIFRYHFGRSFTNYTIISIVLGRNLLENVKNNVLNEKDRILRNVKEYIENNLNSKKRNFLNPLKDNYKKVTNIPDVPKQLILTEDQYYDALSIQIILIFKFI